MIVRVRRSYFSEKEFRKNRTIAVVLSLVLHSIVIVALFFYQQEHAITIGPTNEEELSFGSSGGGGAENANKDAPVEFGPHQPTQDDPSEVVKKATVNLINIHIQQEAPKVENALPVPEKEKPKVNVAKKTKPKKPLIAEHLPIGHVRHGGQGPGSGGGMGGGSGGGIGARQGYAIDWGGSGSRLLLSGRLPEYPKGTDKQMAVILKFSVLPDGSVDLIVPTRKTDELLERAAIAALQTWRFDPLPAQAPQKSQTGKVTFNFKLE